MLKVCIGIYHNKEYDDIDTGEGYIFRRRKRTDIDIENMQNTVMWIGKERDNS